MEEETHSHCLREGRELGAQAESGRGGGLGCKGGETDGAGRGVGGDLLGKGGERRGGEGAGGARPGMVGWGGAGLERGWTE